jgi:hypothetical protein
MLVTMCFPSLTNVQNSTDQELWKIMEIGKNKGDISESVLQVAALPTFIRIFL